MPQLIWAVVMMIVAYAIQVYLTPKPKNASFGQLDVPVAEEGATISVVFGTVLIKDANVMWYGDSGTKEIYSSGGKK